jgi:hypothetical protein
MEEKSYFVCRSASNLFWRDLRVFAKIITVIKYCLNETRKNAQLIFGKKIDRSLGRT